MDFDTARRFVLAQTLSPVPGQTSFITCLRQGEAPVPGQVTSLLLALKTLSQALKNEPMIERSLGISTAVERIWADQAASEGG